MILLYAKLLDPEEISIPPVESPPNPGDKAQS